MSSFPFCKSAAALLRSLRGGEYLPPFEKDNVASVCSEINDVSRQLGSYLQKRDGVWGDDSESIAPYLLLSCAERDKKCLVAYLYERVQKIERARWEAGSMLPDEIKANMSDVEKEYFNAYGSILTEYMEEVDEDLGVYLEPPKSLFVEVRAKKDIGEISTESGQVNLSRFERTFVRRVEVEQLLRSGLIERTDGEDAL